MDKDPDDTVPGLTKDADGTFRIGPGDQKRAEKEAFENGDRVMGEINDEAARGRKPGSPAGDDSPESKKNSSA